MLSDTLRDGLDAYAIGPKIRALRQKQKMGLVELGRHTGLSPAMLSKIERGRLFPTLPTLLRIALVFSVGLDHFFTGDRDRPAVAVVRTKDRLTFPAEGDDGNAVFEFQSLDFPATERRFNAFYADFLFSGPGPLRLHAHPGGEFLYVLRGRLEVDIAGEPYVLDAGDSMYFDSSAPHGYRRVGTKPCSAIVVTAR